METRKNIMYAREVQPANEWLSEKNPFAYVKEETPFISLLTCSLPPQFVRLSGDSIGLDMEQIASLLVQQSVISRVYVLAVSEETYHGIHDRNHYPSSIRAKMKEVEETGKLHEFASDKEHYSLRSYRYTLNRSDFDVLGICEQNGYTKELRVFLNQKFKDSPLSQTLIKIVGNKALIESFGECPPDIIMACEQPSQSAASMQSTMALVAQVGVFANRSELESKEEKGVITPNNSPNENDKRPDEYHFCLTM